MNFLGFCRDTGACYEGESQSHGYRIQVAPVLTPVRFAEVDDIPGLSKDSFGFHEVVFREHDFDPITRIRRGAVFTKKDQNQEQTWHVQDPFRQDLKRDRFGHGYSQSLKLITYRCERLIDAEFKAIGSRRGRAILGFEPHESFWKIVSVENVVSGGPLLTLKAIFSLGDLPDLNEATIPPEIREHLIGALEKVNDSINRQGAAEVIDCRRDALSIVFGYLCGDRSKDLGLAVNAYAAMLKDGKDDLRASVAKCVVRLHPRRKPNEEFDKGVRPPTGDDAQFAVQCLGLVLVETGWAC